MLSSLQYIPQASDARRPPAGPPASNATAHTHHPMSGMPGNIAPAHDVAPSELPDGFTLAGGGAAGGGGGGAGVGSDNSPADAAAQQQRDAHRQAILEQAMTPEALARLRRVKVGADEFGGGGGESSFSDFSISSPSRARALPSSGKEKYLFAFQLSETGGISKKKGHSFHISEPSSDRRSSRVSSPTSSHLARAHSW